MLALDLRFGGSTIEHVSVGMVVICVRVGDDSGLTGLVFW